MPRYEKGTGKFVEFKCGHCGKDQVIDRYQYNKRMEISKSKVLYCSTKCGGIARRLAKEATK